MKKPKEQMQDQLNWLVATAHAGAAARFDIGIGDAEKRHDSFFIRAGQSGLTVDEIMRRGSFYRAANSSGFPGKAERPLNLYLKSNPENQSWIMLDDLTLEQCIKIAGNRTHMTIETSPGRHHLWLAASRPLTIAERGHCQKILVSKFECGDPASTDGDHFGRLAGFKNVKRKCWVNLIAAEITDRRADVDKLLALPLSGVAFVSSPKGACVLSLPQASVSPSFVVSLPANTTSLASSSLDGRDESRAEYGWALGWIKSGQSVEKGVARLAERAAARNKKQSQKYAERTFAAAARRLQSRG